MSTAPTSNYTFNDLIKEVARAIGVGYYGTNGDGALDTPVDAYDLDQCKRLVNDGIRMFIADAPQPNGWRWMEPVAYVNTWISVSNDSTNTLTFDAYDSTNDRTKLTATTDSFYESMEEKTLTVKGGGSYVIKQYADAKNVYVYGDASGETNGSEWSLTADGNFTLPKDFSGDSEGQITYGNATNRGMYIEWCDESVIREWRANIDSNTGTPIWAAIRPIVTKSNRRRWELCLYPQPDEHLQVSFRYTVGFDLLVDLTDEPPTPAAHDETIKAACLAVAERDVEDMTGPKMSYYRQVALANSYRIDAQSAPRKLGYFGNPPKRMPSLRNWRKNWMQRPDVTFNS